MTADRRSSDITQLLKRWASGDDAALNSLMPLVYDHLRKLARSYARSERAAQTLQPTALLNETFLRLVETRNLVWHDRSHFFAVCARMMRRILVDAARSRAAAKRGGRAD